MQKKVTLIGVVLILALAMVACGGENSEPVVSDDTGAADTTGGDNGEDTAPQATEAPQSEDGEDGSEAAEATEPAEEEETASEEASEETGEGEASNGDTVAGRPASGADPESGMQINPPELIQGEEFIVRGEIVSLNLTPQTTPEFLVEAPSGQTYRIRSQELSAVTYEDGTTIAPHEFRQGMLAEATVYQDPSAGLTTVVESEDFHILTDE